MKLNLKLLPIVTFTFLLSVLPVAGAVTYEELESGIIRRCEVEFTNVFEDTSEIYSCILIQLSAFKKVLGRTYDPDMGYYREHNILVNQIMNEHWDEVYATAEWPVVLDELEEFLSKTIPYIPAE